MENMINEATEDVNSMEEDNSEAAVERKAKCVSNLVDSFTRPCSYSVSRPALTPFLPRSARYPPGISPTCTARFSPLLSPIAVDVLPCRYMELMKREKEMNAYLSHYDDKQGTEAKKLDDTETRIVELLGRISVNTLRSGALPDRADVAKDRKALQLKQRELSRSEQTANSMADKNAKLSRDLNNVQNLEVKITSELATLKEKIDTMGTELVTYDDLSGLKEVTESTKKRLLADKKRLMMRREITKRTMAEKGAQYERSKATLAGNESHMQLMGLEKKWQSLEKEKYRMDDFIKGKEAESYYKPYVAKVTGLIKEHNRELRMRDTKAAVSVAV